MLKIEIWNLIKESLEISAGEFTEDDYLLKCPTWDSLGILSLIGNFNEKYKIKIESSNLYKLKTFNDLLSYLMSLKN